MQPWNCISPLRLSLFSVNIPCIKPPQTGNFSEQLPARPRSLCNVSMDESWGSLRAKHRLGTGQSQLCDCKELVVNMLQACSLRRDLWWLVCDIWIWWLRELLHLWVSWVIPGYLNSGAISWGSEQFFRCSWGKFREEMVDGVSPKEEQKGCESLEKGRELLKCWS